MASCIKLLVTTFCLYAASADSACTNGADHQIWENIKDNISSIQQACILKGAPGAAWYDHCIKHFMNSSSDGEKCMMDCVERRTHLSTSCSACFGRISRCTYEHCISPCIDAASPACSACGNKYCTADFANCSGITDLPHTVSSLSGSRDSVLAVAAAVSLATQTVSGIPDSLKKILHDFVCDGLKDGDTKDDVVSTLCKQVHSKVQFVSKDTCKMVLERLWEHEEVGLCKSTPIKAAELRRWENSDNCSGNYTVLNHDNMNECTQFLIPAPASIWVEQKNETAYSSFHCQGVLDCSKEKRKLLSDFVVGTCDDLGGYSQMRVWIKAEAMPMLVI